MVHSLNISRGKIFADFVVLEDTTKNFTLKYFRPPYSVIHFRSVCKCMKIFFLGILLNLEKFTP